MAVTPPDGATRYAKWAARFKKDSAGKLPQGSTEMMVRMLESPAIEGRIQGSFDDIYWIVGGRAKDGGLAGLEAFYPKITRAYLIGEAAEDFAHQLGDAVPHVVCGTLDRAVTDAARDAGGSDASEPVVLLSPASASFDQFDNFAKRGDAFCELVLGLDGATSVTQRGKAA